MDEARPEMKLHLKLMSFSVLQLVRVMTEDGGLEVRMVSCGVLLPHSLSAYYVTGTVLAVCMLSRFQ